MERGWSTTARRSKQVSKGGWLPLFFYVQETNIDKWLLKEKIAFWAAFLENIWCIQPRIMCILRVRENKRKENLYYSPFLYSCVRYLLNSSQMSLCLHWDTHSLHCWHKAVWCYSMPSTLPQDHRLQHMLLNDPLPCSDCWVVRHVLKPHVTSIWRRRQRNWAKNRVAHYEQGTSKESLCSSWLVGMRPQASVGHL